MAETHQRIAAIVVLFCLSAAISVARTPPGDKVDAYINGVMGERHIPGLSLAIVKEGKIIKQQGYGLASVELKVPAAPETVYQIASTTKNFAGTAAMLLVQEGKLSLDDKVSKLLAGLPDSWSEITVRQIATHTSGLPDLVKNDYSAEVIAETQDDVLKKLADMPLAGKPGEQWKYNQTNYLLLKMIIEKLSGMTFEQFVTKRFFRPFEMTQTSFGDCREIVPGRASLYTRLQIKDGKMSISNDKIWNYFGYVYPDYMHTAAGMNSSVLDLVKWDAAFYAGRVLTQTALDQMWSAARLNDGKPFRFDGKYVGYGCGWIVSDLPGHRAVGGSGGGSTAYRRYLDDKLTIIILTNCQGADPDSIIAGVAALYIPGLPSQ